MSLYLYDHFFCVRYLVFCFYEGCANHKPQVAQDGYEMAQHKIINLLKTFFSFFFAAFVSVCAFNVWPKTTLLLPVWPRDAESFYPRTEFEYMYFIFSGHFE